MQNQIFRTVASGALQFSLTRRQKRKLFRNAGLTAIALAGLYLSFPAIQKTQNSAVMIGNKAGANQDYAEMLSLEQEARQADSEIADQRLKACTSFVFSKNDSQEMAAVSNGLIVTDPVTGQPFGDYSIICDVHGGTGEVINGRLANIKISRNPNRGALVAAALREKGLRIEAGNPNVRAANALGVAQ